MWKTLKEKIIIINSGGQENWSKPNYIAETRLDERRTLTSVQENKETYDDVYDFISQI